MDEQREATAASGETGASRRVVLQGIAWSGAVVASLAASQRRVGAVQEATPDAATPPQPFAESDAFLRGTSLPLQFGEKPLGLAPTRSAIFLANVPISRRIPAMATLPAVEGMFDRAFKQAFYVDADVPKATATIARDIQGMLGDRLTVPSYLFREGMTEIEE